MEVKSIWEIKGLKRLLVLVFINTFIDLGHKVLIQNLVFKYLNGPAQAMLIAVLSLLVIFPFVLAYWPSSYLSTKFSARRIIRWNMVASVVIAFMILLSYATGKFWVAFGLTFVLSFQASLFSPALYEYIRERLGKQNLAEANGYIGAVTLVAAMLAIFLFSVSLESRTGKLSTISSSLQGIVDFGGVLVLLSVLQAATAIFLPRPDHSTSLLSSYAENPVKVVKRSEIIWLSTVGLGLFWGINHVVMANIGAYLKEAAAVNNAAAVQCLLALGGLGIVVGSFFAGRMSRNYIEIGHIPITVLTMASCIFLFPAFYSLPAVAIFFFLFGLAGGFFIVPLNALIQFNAGEGGVSTVTAASNLVQNLVITVALLTTTVLSFGQVRPTVIFHLLFGVAVICLIYVLWKLPYSFSRFLMMKLFARRYKILVEGIDHLPSEGGALLVGNHVTLIDWAILQSACPRPIRFVAHRKGLDNWFFAIFLRLNRAILISSGQAKAPIQKITDCLNQGELVAIFPEGHWTRTGQLSEFQRGFELAVKNTPAPIIPFYIHGLWGSTLSHAPKQNREAQHIKRFRDVYVFFGESLPNSSTALEVKKAVEKLAIHTWKAYAQHLKSLQFTFLEMAKKCRSRTAVIDYDNKSYSFGKLLCISLSIASQFNKKTTVNRRVGILLPPSFAGIAANLAVWIHKGVSINFNYTLSQQGLAQCVEQADPSCIITSRRFVEKLRGKGMDVSIVLEKTQLLYLEDLVSDKMHFLRAWLLTLLPNFILRWHIRSGGITETAAILFSSGSESVPKGVELTHQNILCNIKQVSMIVGMQETDVMVNALPLFHAFGLTVSSMMPLFSGLPVICCPDPTDTYGIAKMIARHKGTILPGTSSFLRLYVRNHKIHPALMKTIRFAVAGAEKLSEDVRQQLKDRFNIVVYEGYGATETSPVASINLPDEVVDESGRIQIGNKQRTVGLALPGCMFRIVDPETEAELANGCSGHVLIGGVQVMKGYLNNAEKTRAALFEQDGVTWYRTGDKGFLDQDEFLTIEDRYSRFAKIGGEMVSLAKVEQECLALFSGSDVAALTAADPKKGEMILLLYAGPLESEAVRRAILESDLSPLMKPRHIVRVDCIPKLASGKTDYLSARGLCHMVLPL